MTKQLRAVREVSGPEAFAETFSVSRETLERLKIYESLLQHWQKTINLVAPGTSDRIWHRHFADSAQIVRLAPPAPKTWVDLGSGAGFPGLVAAILLAEPDNSSKTRFTLIESDNRKAAFLREVARKVAVPVDILGVRIEAVATRANLGGAVGGAVAGKSEVGGAVAEKTADVVSARALAPLTRLLGLALPFSGPNTLCLFPKGREATRELQAAELQWDFTSELVPSLTEPEARIAVISGCKPKQPA
ncbi:MAG: 16S rRNA (guanine(527)-N(7))-methyltransferase RsmG [Gammaproteobacteria bacterium]